jgi:hypothetical protein
MPYIDREQRELIDGPSDYTVPVGLDTFIYKMRTISTNSPLPGTLNYIITRLVVWYLGKNPNYERYNAAIGVLECVKQELYRRQVVPYEDKKWQRNGDVYRDDE